MSGAAGGHLELLQWAREHGCPWDALTYFFALDGEHEEVLRWARDHDCPWDGSMIHAAVEYGSMNVLQWTRGSTAARGMR
jgi:hypothetical protein